METYFSAEFQTIRRKLGYSIAEFAGVLGVDVVQLRQIENEGAMPDLPVLYKLYILGF
jgi:transcriptional regulator with XRE-family HTH domain